MFKTLVKNKMPQVSDLAPDFEASDQDGKKTSLRQFKGKIIVLLFYPNDDTSGCIKEACSLRDRYSSFKKKNVVILGISKDSQKSHQSFIEKYDLPFILISDMDKKVQQAYGVWQEKIMYGRKIMGTVRTTFIIDPEQKVAYIFDKVDYENHAQEILEKLEELEMSLRGGL